MYLFVKHYFLVPTFLLLIPSLFAQEIPEAVKNYIEDFYAIQSDAPQEIDVNMIFDQLTYFLENPISVNQSSREELQELQLLSTLQIDAFLNYRDEFGPLVDIHELQAIPHFDLQTIRRIQAFISLGATPSWTTYSLNKMLRDAKGTYYFRFNKTLEKAKGFLADEGMEAPFEGKAGRIFTRLQYRLPKKFSLGVTAEKDHGEAFLTGSNPQGFDYYTFHVFIEKPVKWLSKLALGDYNLSLGQGLILHSGFGGGKSAFATNIKRGGYPIRPHTSIAENTFLRGVAADISIAKNWSTLIFYSDRRIDGNIVTTVDTLDRAEPGLIFTSINNSGFHRTEQELADENALHDRIIGGRIAFEKDQFQLRLNYFTEQFSAPLDRRDELYNLFVPEADFYQFMSIDYTWIGKAYHFFGETAYNGYGFSTLNGILSAPLRDIQVALLYRYFDPRYFSLNANAFGEVQQASNENGLYVGLNWHIYGPFHVSAYADVWQHPWLRYNVDAPSNGNEYMIRLQYYKKRQFEAYLQFRSKTRGTNLRADDDKTAVVLPDERLQLRLHISQQLNKDIELRYRAEWIRSEQLTQSPHFGFLLYGDVIYKPLGFPLSFTTRFAIYNTDGYDARLYAYENNLLYSFSIPAYFEQGTRSYINVRWKVYRNLTWEARFARTWRYGVESIGSGQNEIEGNTKTEVATQIKLTF